MRSNKNETAIVITWDEYDTDPMKYMELAKTQRVRVEGDTPDTVMILDNSPMPGCVCGGCTCCAEEDF